MDSNQFNDFAVGAPFVESAVVLRSRPVISFKHKVIFNFPKAIDPEVGEHLEHINMKMDFKTGCEQPNKCKCGMKFSLKNLQSYDVKVGQQNSLDLEFD